MRYLILLAFLPYLKTSPLASDTQPHFIIAFLGTLMLWTVVKKRLPIRYFTLFVSICMFPIGLALNAGQALIPLVIAPIAIDFFASQHRKDFIWAAKAALIIYYIGIALNILAPGVLEMAVANFRTSPLRGLNSFTSEPSYLGLVALCLTAILITLNAPRKWGGGGFYWCFFRVPQPR